jgi:hypothetical protein
MSSKLPVRVIYIFRMRRWSAAELRSAWTGEGARPHTGTREQGDPNV